MDKITRTEARYNVTSSSSPSISPSSHLSSIFLKPFLHLRQRHHRDQKRAFVPN